MGEAGSTFVTEKATGRIETCISRINCHTSELSNMSDKLENLCCALGLPHLPELKNPDADVNNSSVAGIIPALEAQTDTLSAAVSFVSRSIERIAQVTR